ncbi:EamA family transporter [Chloroflexota bacterium]
MSAGVLAVLAALTFSFYGIISRRAVVSLPDATAGVLISVPISVPFFIFILAITGQISDVTSFSWQSYLWLSAAGIVHFIIGRSLSYKCVQLVGMNISNIVQRVSTLVAVTLGITVLSEPITWQLTVGVLLITTGVLIAGSNSLMFKGNALAGISPMALLFGLGAGIAWGTSPILIKIGLEGSGSPVAGAFISYSAATIALGISMWDGKRREALFSLKGRTAVLFSLAGLLAAGAHLLRYIALSMAPASVISPIFSISPIFMLTLAFLFNRKLELFSAPVIIGTIAVVIGSLLLV